MNKEQLIQDYFADRLSGKEKLKVEQLLDSDATFKADFESYEDISMAFKLSEATQLKKHFVQFEEKTQTKTVFQRFRYAYLAIASIIVIGLFYKTFNTTSGAGLYADYFEIYPNTYQPVTRSNATSKDMEAFVFYENKRFKSAEKEFESILQTSQNPAIRFYYASTLLNQSKFEVALKEFTVLNKITHDYLPESLWYTVLIHVKNEDYTEAIKNLKRLNSIKSKFKSGERKLLLQKLND